MEEYKDLPEFQCALKNLESSTIIPESTEYVHLEQKLHEIIDQILDSSSFEEASVHFNSLVKHYNLITQLLKSNQMDAESCDLRDLIFQSIKIVMFDCIPLDVLMHVEEFLTLLISRNYVTPELMPKDDVVLRIVGILHEGLNSLFTECTEAVYLPITIKLLGFIITDAYAFDAFQKIHEIFNCLPLDSKMSALLLYLNLVVRHKQCIGDYVQSIINDALLFIRSCTIALDDNDSSYVILLCTLYIQISLNWKIDPIDDEDIQIIAWIDYVIKVHHVPIIWRFLQELIKQNEMIVYSLGTTFAELNALAIHNIDCELLNYISYLIDTDLVDPREFRKLFKHIIRQYSMVRHRKAEYKFILAYIDNAKYFNDYKVVFNTYLDENIFNILNDGLECYVLVNDTSDNEDKFIRVVIDIYVRFRMRVNFNADVEESFNTLARVVINEWMNIDMQPREKVLLTKLQELCDN